MKVSCTQENLAKGVTSVNRVVGIRGTLPILSHVLLSTDKGQLKIAGTDLEIGIVSHIGAKIDQEGSVTVPARLLTEFVGANRDKTIDIEVTGTKIKLSSEHVTAHLNGLATDDFPLIPDISAQTPVMVKSNELKEVIAQVAFAVALDDSRPILTGVSVKVAGNQLTMAATDSYRLAERVMTLGKNFTDGLLVIVPARTLQEVGRLLPIDDSEVSIVVAENQIGFTFGQTKVVSRVLEGSFPDYEQIIPKTKTTTAVVKAGELQNALKLGSSFAREVANNIRLIVSPGNPIQVIATSPQVGDTTAQVEAKTTGEELEIAFNAKFLIDVLAASQTDSVTLNFSGSLSPAVITPVNQTNYRTLVMPLRLDEVS